MEGVETVEITAGFLQSIQGLGSLAQVLFLALAIVFGFMARKWKEEQKAAADQAAQLATVRDAELTRVINDRNQDRSHFESVLSRHEDEIRRQADFQQSTLLTIVGNYERTTTETNNVLRELSQAISGIKESAR